MNSYYVYVYIDPRNFQEFYYGKGRGARKGSHLKDTSDSNKAKQIREIKKAGLEPIIRVIARDLSEHDAFLVEKTLLWKLGRQLTNVSSGHYSNNFRPHFSMHTKIAGFDFQKGFYYYNVGEGPGRNWDDYRKLGFISAGGKDRWQEAMLGFNKGDAFAAYFKRKGFVGIGIITECAKPVSEVRIGRKLLLDHELVQPGMRNNAGKPEQCEYVATVKWLATVDREDAKWKPKSGLFTSQLVRASLDNQPKTVAFLEEEFGININEYIA